MKTPVLMLKDRPISGFNLYSNAPIGTIIMFGGSKVPSGYLPCDGAEVSRTKYNKLFAEIGTYYGNGNGTSTFNLPDYRECSPVGVGKNSLHDKEKTGIDGDIVTHDVFELGQFKDDQMQVHTHSFSSANASGGSVWSNPDGGNYQARQVVTVTTSNSSGRTGSVTRGKSIGTNFYIKAEDSFTAETMTIPKDEAPVGTVHSFVGTIEPSGYLFCHGQAVSRQVYADLFDIIGTTYGEGNGSTTFNLPDYRECSLVGAGENTKETIASHDVFNVGEFKDDQMQGHKHSYTTWSTEQMGRDPPGNYVCRNFNNGTTTGVPVTDGTNGTPRTGSVTRGKSIGVNYIIKALKTTGSINPDVELDDSKYTNANVLSAKKVKDMTQEVYSTEEVVVGTWLDNRPIYKKSFAINGTISSSSYTDVGITIPNLRTIVKPLEITDPLYNLFYFNVSGDKINFAYNGTGSRTISNQFATVWYTKSTD